MATVVDSALRVPYIRRALTQIRAKTPSWPWLARHTRPDCLFAINALYAHPSTTMCSTVEAETHCATSTAVKTSVLRDAMEQLGFPQTDPTTIQEDNQAIAEEE
jgi:hypothetical protein